jgi:hypothetical protein
MTAVKTHSMALKEGDVTKIQIETLNPILHLRLLVGLSPGFKRERRSMFSRLFNE